MMVLVRLCLRAVIFLGRFMASLSIRVVRWTGKSPWPLHPKHLAGVSEHYWYLEGLAATDTVLDLGCGSGTHALQTARKARWVVGVDRNAEHLATALAGARQAGITNLAFLRVDAEQDLPFRAHCFTRVLCLDVLEHLQHRDRALQNIRGVLDSTGCVFLALPNRETSWRRLLRRAGLPSTSDPDHKVEYTMAEIGRELLHNGLAVQGKAQPVTLDVPLAGLIDLVGAVHLGLYRRLGRCLRSLALRYPGESTGFRLVGVKVRR